MFRLFHHKKTASKNPSRRLTLEVLEDRTTPSPAGGGPTPPSLGGIPSDQLAALLSTLQPIKVVVERVEGMVGDVLAQTFSIRTFLAHQLESEQEEMTPLPPAIGPGDPSFGGISGLPGSPSPDAGK